MKTALDKELNAIEKYRLYTDKIHAKLKAIIYLSLSCQMICYIVNIFELQLIFALLTLTTCFILLIKNLEHHKNIMNRLEKIKCKIDSRIK